MRKFGLLALVAAAITLVGCGGNDNPSSFANVVSTSSSSSSSSSSSGSSSSSSSGSSLTTVSSITLISSAPQLPSNNTTAATITAIAKNSANAIVTGADIVFSASSGVIAPQVTTTTGSVAGVTDTNGEAQAALTTPGDPANRTLTVTATVGTVSASINLAVVGTQLSLTGPSSLILGANGTFAVALTDSGGNGIPNSTVTVGSAKKNTLSATTLTTDSTGHVSFTLTAANAGTDTVTVTALGSSATQTLSVSSQNFAFATPAANTTVPLNTAQPVQLVWDNNGAPVPNTAVTLSTTRGTFAGGTTTLATTTDGTGVANATVSASSAGPAIISAAATGVSAQVAINFVATTPSQIDVQANPSTVATSGSSTITAIVRDAQGNLVANQTVDFQLSDQTGGAISVATATTNSQGVASTVYTATTTSSPANGVTVTATVQNTSIQGSVNLTVGGQTVFLSLGTGNTLNPNPSAAQFSLPYTVQALDSGGNPVSGVTVTFTIHSFPYADIPAGQTQSNGSVASGYAAYGKGGWILTATSTANAAAMPPVSPVCNGPFGGTTYCQVTTTTCFNEDVTGSGVLQSPSEDINGNGRLDPGDVASVSPGSGVTDSTGSILLAVIYPQDDAGWVHVMLTASATVAGTQSSTNSVFWLPMAGDDINGATVPPPGETSPYGTASVCTDPN